MGIQLFIVGRINERSGYGGGGYADVSVSMTAQHFDEVHELSGGLQKRVVLVSFMLLGKALYCFFVVFRSRMQSFSYQFT